MKFVKKYIVEAFAYKILQFGVVWLVLRLLTYSSFPGGLFFLSVHPVSVRLGALMRSTDESNAEIDADDVAAVSLRTKLRRSGRADRGEDDRLAVNTELAAPPDETSHPPARSARDIYSSN